MTPWRAPDVPLLSEHWPPLVLRVPHTPQERLIAGFFRRILVVGECIYWTGSLGDHGYGIYRGQRAHVFSYRLMLGPVPDHLWVCHWCNNRPCIRPGHLYLGTPGQNMAQKVNDGRAGGGARGLIGQLNNGVRIDTAQAQYALDLHAAGYRQVDIARLAGLTPSNTHNIVRRETWKHLVPNADAILEPPLIPRRERRPPRKHLRGLSATGGP